MNKLKFHLFPVYQFIFKIFGALLIFIAPISSAMIAVSFLIVMDTISGIWASIKKGVGFSSKKFSNSLTKLLFYLVLLLTSHVVETQLVSILPMVELSVYFIVFYEFSSFLENVGVIVDRDIFSWFKEAMGRLKDFKVNKK